jgi:2-dehydro-3-deoxygalactonokinase
VSGRTDIEPEWVGIDWGTSNLRGWAMRGGEALASAQSKDGMGSLDRDAFGPALARLTEGWTLSDATPMFACGMVGSRQGWIEAPYRAVPAAPLGGEAAQVAWDGHHVHVLPGLKQQSPPDVMRGEETQISGFLSLNDGWDGVICLPGTHTKWVQVSAGEVVSFQTFMTGELFALLSEGSVLRHSVAGEVTDVSAFDAAVEETISRPEKLASRLFSIRAEDLLNGVGAAVARARLSGLLVGAELAAARAYWLGTQIAVIGAEPHAGLYARALEAQGAPATRTDADRMTRAGLTAAWRRWKDTP